MKKEYSYYDSLSGTHHYRPWQFSTPQQSTPTSSHHHRKRTLLGRSNSVYLCSNLEEVWLKFIFSSKVEGITKNPSSKVHVSRRNSQFACAGGGVGLLYMFCMQLKCDQSQLGSSSQHGERVLTRELALSLSSVRASTTITFTELKLKHCTALSL